MTKTAKLILYAMVLTMALLSILILPRNASAATCWWYESKLDSKQYAYTLVQVQKNGRVVSSTLFSNGKRFGDNFGAQIMLFDQFDTPLMGFQYIRGVNATLGGKTTEVRETRSETLDDSVKFSINWVGVRHFHKDRYPDNVIGNFIGKVVAFIINSKRNDEIAGMPIEYTIEIENEERKPFEPPENIADLPKANKLDSCPVYHGESSGGGTGGLLMNHLK